MSIWKENYTQYEEYYLRNACSIITLLNILKFNFAIVVRPTFIIKTAVFFERLGLFNPASWASFSSIYKMFVWELNRRLWLNFEVIVNQISKLTQDDRRSYWVWIKWYWTVKWNRIKADWFITRDEMDYLASFSWGVGHNLLFDNDAWWKIIDTDWNKNVRMPLSVLKYWLSLGIFWDNIRTISPADEYTNIITHYTIKLFIAEKKWKLSEYLEVNKDNKDIMKAKEVYLYWR